MMSIQSVELLQISGLCPYFATLTTVNRNGPDLTLLIMPISHNRPTAMRSRQSHPINTTHTHTHTRKYNWLYIVNAVEPTISYHAAATLSHIVVYNGGRVPFCVVSSLSLSTAARKRYKRILRKQPAHPNGMARG